MSFSVPAEPPQAPKTVEELIVDKSLEYNVSADLMRKIIYCESGGRKDAIGDAGHSRGLVQIHRPSWPDITDEQAFDPEFAISFLAEKLSENKGYLWTCHKLVLK